jgi:hypothetical protein
MSQARILLLLLALLIIAAWYAWQATPRQQRSPKSVAVETSGEGNVQSKTATMSGLDFSGGEKSVFQQPERDLFRPLYRTPKIVAQPVEKPKPEPIVVKPPPPPPPPPQPKPVIQPVAGPKPIPKLEVLGFLKKGATKTVFLSTRQGDLYLVKKGDRFADGLLVRELDATKIVISRGQDDQGVTLPVSTPKSQKMAIHSVPSGRPNVPAFSNPSATPQKPAVGAEQD